MIKNLKEIVETIKQTNISIYEYALLIGVSDFDMDEFIEEVSDELYGN